MPADFDKAPYSYYAPPGAVRLSADALKMAREFDQHIKDVVAESGWVVGFEWAFARRVRQSPDAAWEELGPGVDLGAYARSDLPAEAIQRIDGLELVIKIPRDVYEGSTERLIDVDETAFSKLVLR